MDIFGHIAGIYLNNSNVNYPERERDRINLNAELHDLNNPVKKVKSVDKIYQSYLTFTRSLMNIQPPVKWHKK